MTDPSGIVTLLTDFGHRDPFVGMMKGVILARSPAARLVDLTHEIPPQDRRAAAYWVARSCLGFPPGTVHLVVVDPGVGTERALVVAEIAGQWLVAPDNGVLAELAQRCGVTAVHAIDRRACGLPAPSRTFHGRDLLAPVAAALATGSLRPAAVGPRTELVAPGFAPAQVTDHRLEGTVVVCDHFGNLLTDLSTAAVERLAAGRGAGPARDGQAEELLVWVGDCSVPWRRTYADVAPGALVALDNAHGDLEIACRDGSAAERLGLGPGAPVHVARARGTR